MTGCMVDEQASTGVEVRLSSAASRAKESTFCGADEVINGDTLTREEALATQGVS